MQDGGNKEGTEELDVSKLPADSSSLHEPDVDVPLTAQEQAAAGRQEQFVQQVAAAKEAIDAEKQEPEASPKQTPTQKLRAIEASSKEVEETRSGSYKKR